MSKLPDTWTDVEIGAVADVIGGGTPKANDEANFTAPGEGVAWLTPADFSGYKPKLISRGARDLTLKGYQSCSAKLIPKGSLLFSSRAPIGYVAVAANEIATNQGFKSFVFFDGIDPNYAFYYLKSIRQLADSLGTGTTFKELSGTTAKTLPFRLAPTAEQTRIAAKLDELLAQVDTLKTRIDVIPALLKRFRQSVLAAAVSGRLTEEWRVKNLEDENAGNCISDELKHSTFDLTFEIPKSWRAVKLKDACRVVSGFAFSSDSFVTTGVPVIKISNVQYGRFEAKNQEYLPPDFVSLHKKFIVSPTDLLMALTRPITNNILKVCEYPKDAALGLLNQRVCKFIFEDPKVKKFFEYLFQADYFKKQVANNLSETLQPNLSPKSLELFIIGLPPLQEQFEIVHRIEQLFAFADQLENRIKAAQARIDVLTQSILAKAFNGDLVPQDPNDEPAAVLLDRIKAQRAEAPKAKRGRQAATLG